MSTSTETNRTVASDDRVGGSERRLLVCAGAVLRAAPLAASLVFLVFAVRAGMPWTNMARAVLVVGATHLVPGMLVWRSLRPSSGWLLEDVIAGFAVGTALAVAGQALFGLLPLALVAWVPSAVATVAVLALPGPRRRALRARTMPMPMWWGPAVGLVMVPLLASVQRFYRMVPLRWEAGFLELPTDIHFHLSIVGQLAHRDPGSIPFVQGEPLSYHWFSHAWVAHVAKTAGVPLDEALFRVGPPVLALGLVLGVAAVAVRISGRAWAGPVAALVAVTSGDVNPFGGVSIFTRGMLTTHGALSLQFASLLIVVLVGLLSARWTGGARRGSGLLVVILALAAAGGKGSALPVVLAGLALAFLVALVSGWQVRRRIGVDLALVTGGFGVVFLVVFGVSSRSTLDVTRALSEAGISAYFLKPLDDPALGLVALGALLVVASVMARASGLLAGLSTADLRRDPMAFVLLGASLAATAAVVMLSTGGKSQYYFLRNAVPLMALGSALGLVALRQALGSAFHRIVILGALAGLVALTIIETSFPTIGEATPGLLATTITRSGVFAGFLGVAAFVAARSTTGERRLPAAATALAVGALTLSIGPTLHANLTSPLPEGPQAVAPTARFAVSADQIEAARWLRDHSGVDDVVATNRHCASPTWVNCDSRRFAISAYTERRVLLEGYAYTRGWAEQPGGTYKPFWDQVLQTTNDVFFESPTPQAARALAELGVQWAYVDKTTDWDPGVTDVAEPVYETEWALVLELPTAE